MFIFFVATIYWFLPDYLYQGIFSATQAVLLTFINLPPSVKFVNSNSSLVFKFLTVTDTPLSVIAAADILARVSSERLIPLRASDTFFMSSSVKIIPFAARDKFCFVSSHFTVNVKKF